MNTASENKKKAGESRIQNKGAARVLFNGTCQVYYVAFCSPVVAIICRERLYNDTEE
jgi:hypothetical protein